MSAWRSFAAWLALRWRALAPLTVSQAVLIGGALIAAALTISPLLAPYRFQAAMLGGFWRFNAVTGEAVLCLAETGPFNLACSRSYRLESVMPQ